MGSTKSCLDFNGNGIIVDTSCKLQAARFKRQAASDKLLDRLTLIKFHVARSEVLDHDKTILRM